MSGRVTLRDWPHRAAKSLSYAVRWRARNWETTVLWLRLRAAGNLAWAYSDDFWDFHSGGDWTGFADLLLRDCRPRSVVDVGCGDGKLLAALLARAPGLPVLGIDSSPSALVRAAAAGVPTEQHELDSLRGRALAPLRARISQFDMVISLETVEHLPPWAGRSFVKTLAQPRLVVFSAARPFQGGTLHLNERPPEYWRDRFAARRYDPAAFETALRGDLSRLDLPTWYSDNLQVFERRA